MRQLGQNNLALTELFAGLLHGARQRQPVLNVGGENVRHHVAGQLGDQAIEHDRRVTLLIRQPRPI